LFFGGVSKEIFRCKIEFGEFPVLNPAKVYFIPGKVGNRSRQVLEALSTPSSIKHIQANKKGISCKGRKGGVRRVPVACGSDGQYLPERLAGFFQKIDETVSLRADFPYAVLTWQETWGASISHWNE
jgi:hypothetical protein